MFYEILVRLCAEKGTTPTSMVKELGISGGSVTWWKQGKIPHAPTLKKIADYFGVTVEYLLGKEEKEAKKENPSVEEEFKIALFGGKENVSEEKWDQIMNYAKFLIEQDKKK